MMHRTMHGDSTREAQSAPAPPNRAHSALVLLLCINLFNYIDRQILAAVERQVGDEFLRGQDQMLAKTGLLATVFLVAYTIASPIFGWLADRVSRWLLVGISVTVWSLASGASGAAASFEMLLITRVLVGVGEAGYGPAAPTLLSDYYPARRRGSILAWFYLAIPAGSALGYMLGGFIAKHWGWRVAFYAVAVPGLLLAVRALTMQEPSRGRSDELPVPQRRPRWRDYLRLLMTPSYLLDTGGMAALSFAVGGIAFWMPRYLEHRGAGDEAEVNVMFGAIIAVAGVSATLLGGFVGDRLRHRLAGSYFLVSAAGIFISCPMVLGMLWAPFPWAWGLIFLAVFFLFFNTGPSSAILANVTHPSIRASAFALNIFILHALGDALSPPLLGRIAGPSRLANGELLYSWNAAFGAVAGIMAVAGVLWLWGSRYLQRDTAAALR